MGHEYIKENDTFSTSQNGTVPKPTASDVSNNKVLRADGSWVTQSGGGGGGSSTLAGLDDVDTTGVSDGDLLGYDSNSNKWIPQTPSSGHNYSTTEQVVGTWIDGKPIYEKSYLYENSSGSSASSEIVVVNDFGTDKEIIPGGLQGAFYATTGANYPVPWADCNGSSGNSTGLWISDGKIKLRIRNDSYSSVYKLRITAQYTKKTD